MLPTTNLPEGSVADKLWDLKHFSCYSKGPSLRFNGVWVWLPWGITSQGSEYAAIEIQGLISYCQWVPEDLPVKVNFRTLAGGCQPHRGRILPPCGVQVSHSLSLLLTNSFSGSTWLSLVMSCKILQWQRWESYESANRILRTLAWQTEGLLRNRLNDHISTWGHQALQRRNVVLGSLFAFQTCVYLCVYLRVMYNVLKLCMFKEI